MTRELLVKMSGIAMLLVALAASPVFAQESEWKNAPGYVTVFGGPVWSGGNSSGNVVFEGGARIVRHVMVFGNVGRFSDLQKDFEPTVDAATTSLSSQGIDVISEGTLPAWYGVGGVRAEIPANKHLLPYALGGIGGARLNPTPKLTFSSGVMPDGSGPDVGTDVTPALESAGSISVPAASTAFMYMLGGGAQIPVVRHWAADVGYRYSRIAADSTLSADALNTNAMTFGFGYRF